MKTPILRAENLVQVYGAGTPFERTAVDHVSFELYENEFIGVIGHTGSGKSTLIQMLNGLMKPTSGTVYFQEEDVWAKKYDRRNLRANVGLVFQYPEYQLFEETVEKDIAFGPKNMGLSEDEIARRVKEAMAVTGLSDKLRNKSPFELSGGQKRRVAIAGILAMRPRVLILDEPTAGLDPKGCNEILANVRAYQKEESATVILVSHSMEDIAANAGRVMVLERGNLKMFDDTRSVFARGEELLAMGLNVPQITRVFLTLKQQGYETLPSVLSPEEAIRSLDLLTGGAK
ncbi:MAG: energy-coupling factor transporter ATPase [Clostridia bacterium]|nr:energy-coupling factor transporter ATPase [Clostridia bacterium]